MRKCQHENINTQISANNRYEQSIRNSNMIIQNKQVNTGRERTKTRYEYQYTTSTRKKQYECKCGIRHDNNTNNQYEHMNPKKSMGDTHTSNKNTTNSSVPNSTRKAMWKTKTKKTVRTFKCDKISRNN